MDQLGVLVDHSMRPRTHVARDRQALLLQVRAGEMRGDVARRQDERAVTKPEHNGKASPLVLVLRTWEPAGRMSALGPGPRDHLVTRVLDDELRGLDADLRLEDPLDPAE